VADRTDDLEDELRDMLSRRAADVRPRVTGADLRALAAQRRKHWPARLAPMLAAAVVLVLAVVAFALLGRNPGHPQPVRPAGPGTSTGRSVAPEPSSPPPTSGSPTTSAPTPTVAPTTTPPVAVATAGPPFGGATTVTLPPDVPWGVTYPSSYPASNAPGTTPTG
jgi:hypothetical protein